MRGWVVVVATGCSYGAPELLLFWSTLLRLLPSLMLDGAGCLQFDAVLLAVESAVSCSWLIGAARNHKV